MTNEQGDAVDYPPDTVVYLAHACNTPPALDEAWAEHLKDYDVTPLFPQFGRETYTLPEDDREATDIKDFVGHMLTTFQLRSQAFKLGFLRREAEDGGCFFIYRKPFPALELQAVIEFSGSYVPEADMAAALQNLYFLPITQGPEDANPWASNKLALRNVPPVLLSECYNDLQQIAAMGTGYDPEWRKKGFAVIG